MAYLRRTRLYKRTATSRKAQLVRKVRVQRAYRRVRKVLRSRRAHRQQSQARYARFYTNEEHSYNNTIPVAHDVFSWGDMAKPVTGRSTQSVSLMATKYSQFKCNLVVIKITPVYRQMVATTTTSGTGVNPKRMAGLVLPNAQARNNDKPAPTFADLMNMPGVKTTRYGDTLKLYMRPKHYVFNGLQNTSLGSNTLQVRAGWQDTAMLLAAPPGGADYLGTYHYMFDQHQATAETLLVEKFFYCSFKGERSALFSPT